MELPKGATCYKEKASAICDDLRSHRTLQNTSANNLCVFQMQLLNTINLCLKSFATSFMFRR